MKIELTNARFTSSGAELEINGQTCSVDSKWSVVREGLCCVRGPRDLVATLHTTPHPDAEGLRFCNHWPLVELAARFWWMSNNDDASLVWPPGAVEILHDEAAARDAWLLHLKAVDALEA